MSLHARKRRRRLSACLAALAIAAVGVITPSAQAPAYADVQVVPSYMGGPDVPGPCTYTDGQVRVGNGFAGSPGEIVRIGPDGKTLSEAPAGRRSRAL